MVKYYNNVGAKILKYDCVFANAYFRIIDTQSIYKAGEINDIQHYQCTSDRLTDAVKCDYCGSESFAADVCICGV